MASNVSLYADDVVVFCHPHKDDLAAVREHLRVFCIASRLCTNLTKCAALPIQCSPDDKAAFAAGFSMPNFGVLDSILGLAAIHP